jgi:cellulose synthase/poly-beta-1,6-N-acetylglucosamine synthase-like glycosyltransferase
MSPLSLVALSAAVLVLLPCAILAFECLAACLPARKNRFALVRVPHTAVLVPAHDEEACLPAALRSIEPELSESDRLLVVAHNCSDRTAMVARALGAEVLEVRDGGGGGKPAALEAGLRHLAQDPPEVVVVVDADCLVLRGAIRTLAMAAAESGGPVQGDYRFAPATDDAFGSLSSLALMVKNFVRPLGLTRLGSSCLLNGAGSAYPFEQILAAPHGQGSIAEDYQLAIDLAKAGHPTRFVPDARVRSLLPARRDAALGQRRRWEHGHLALVLHTAPGLLLHGLRTLDRHLIFLGVDLLVPPLAFLVLAWGTSAVLAVAALAFTGQGAALGTVLAAGILLALGPGCALARFAGLAELARALVRAPGYLWAKLPLYLAFFVRPERRWRKTERTSVPPAPAVDEPLDERSGTGS